MASVFEYLPAAVIGLTVTAVLCGAQLLPFGKTLLLVRVAQPGASAALAAAASADAAFVSIPAAGYAVLYGDASRVRAATGLAVSWEGSVPCSPAT